MRATRCRVCKVQKLEPLALACQSTFHVFLWSYSQRALLIVVS